MSDTFDEFVEDCLSRREEKTVNKVTLKEFSGSPKRITFNVSSSNGHTTVDQDINIKLNYNDWVADMCFKNFPPDCKTPTEAAYKLADWMIRLGNAIKEHDDFENINICEL
jgi:hypothetical protein